MSKLTMLPPMSWIRLKKAGKATFRFVWAWFATFIIISWTLMCPALAHAGPLQLGVQAVQDQNYPGAIQYFSEVIQQEGESHATAYGNRCLAHLLMDLSQQAAEDCTAALKLNPVSSQAYFYRGLARYRLKHYEGAKADFTQYLQQAPQDARAYYNRGLAVFAQGHVELAIADYQQAVANSSPLTPLEMSNLYNDLGVAYLAQDHFAAAIAALDQAITFDINDPRAYFNRGCVCHRQGNYAAALQDFERVLALDPNHAETYFNRSMVKQRMGNLAGAMADLEAAIARFQQQGNAVGAQRAKLHLQHFERPVSAIG